MQQVPRQFFPCALYHCLLTGGWLEMNTYLEFVVLMAFYTEGYGSAAVAKKLTTVCGYGKPAVFLYMFQVI
jgi:hypothetical protein